MTGPGADPAEAALAAQIDAMFADVDPARPPVPDLAALEQVNGRWRFRLDSMAAMLVAGLAGEMADVLADSDPAAVRPSLYRGDPAAEAAWQSRGDNSILDGRRAVLATLTGALNGATMDDEGCLACVRALTDLRLTLFRLAGEPEAWTAESEPGDVRHSIFSLLGWLVANLLAAVGVD